MVNPRIAAVPPQKPFTAAARLGILVCILCAAICGVPGGSAAEVRAKEITLSDPRTKALWVAKFLHYIEWPTKASPKSGEQITIGYLGDDPIYAELRGLISARPPLVVRGRPVALKRFSGAGDIKGCQVLFISRSAKAEVKSALASVQGTGVLTVSDLDRFTSMGGMIGLRSDGEKIRLEIDGAAAKREGMSIDPELQRAFK